MSIYFQYPAIDEYPNLLYPLKKEKDEQQVSADEDSLNKEQILELSDYLALRQL
ncbi:hypothetical protein [Pedobacter psychrodurus]|uniref:hypothetical protein n=1 Tax=Pedobacter psychrodurus TaxID=2530456 RepID=UPI00292FB412|nr:hypothetical protein [Pedobacter psychrodurus]